ncbi:pectinesterase inhibitor 7 [Coffea arabica]|uniref:Pectinesterase inhibitor 7 n=1 Tax=Coffea arabica TaxID=13443 RepID=A0A6P6V9I7_COFAR|nr:pectinesterase inhibitor 7-like [Coffea arabica]
MDTHQRPLFLITTFLLLLLHHPTSTHSLIDPTTYSTPSAAPTTTSAPTPPATTTTYPTNKDTEFIRSSCASTRYPDECYNSLSGYASAVQQNPARLARVAIAVSLSGARLEATYFSNLSKEADYGADHRVSAAIHDCFSTFGDAVDQLRGSLNQMRHLVPAGSSETFRFQMSNVQTWMSAALTNEDTCTDGFDGVSDGPTKKDVFDRVHRAEAVTSNALALVNSYANTVAADSNFP